MTDIQNRLYEYFLENNPLRDELGGKSLIPDYTILRKVSFYFLLSTTSGEFRLSFDFYSSSLYRFGHIQKY